MMSAEDDVDIDLNVDEDAVREETVSQNNNKMPEVDSIDVDRPLVTPVPVPPMSSQNLLQTDTYDVLDGATCNNADDDKIGEADCVSSDSSVSGNSVVASPLFQKNASGLFDDQTEDFPIAAPSTSIAETTKCPEVETLSACLKSTTIKSNDTPSPFANTLFSSDKSNDDFLSTPDEKSPLPSLRQPYNVKTALDGTNVSSPFLTTNPLTPGNINNQPNTWKTPITTNTLNHTSSLNNVTNQVPSPVNSQPVPELRESLTGTPYSQVSSTYLNETPSTPSHVLPSTPTLYNEKHEYETPLHYNPMNYPQTPVYGSKVTGSTGQISPCYTNPVNTSNLPNMTAGIVDSQNISRGNITPVIGGSNSQSTTPVIGSNLRNSLTYGNNIPNTTTALEANLPNATPVSLQQSPIHGGNLTNITPVMGVNMQHANSDILQNSQSFGISSPHLPPSLGTNLPNSSPHNSVNMTSRSYGATIHDTTPTVGENMRNAMPKKDDGPLFIPQMYCNAKTYADPSSFFVPDQVSPSTSSSPAHFVPSPTHVNNDISPPTYAESIYPQPTQYDISPLAYQDQSEKGILEWLKDRVIRDWPSGAQHIKQYMKTATDSVLTTLDPGMKDYLNTGINIAVASQSMAMLIGIKDGFTEALHAVPVVQGHSMNITDNVLLPLGFERALQTTNDTLDYLTTVKFDLPGQYIVMSAQIFLTELVAGEWFVMYCFGLRDNFKNICLHTFSQPIPLPLACISASYNQMLQNETGEYMGYNIPINEVVRRHIPYDKDWCVALSGKTLHQMVAGSIQCLALNYQRHVDSISPPPPQYTSNTNFSNGVAMNYHQSHPQSQQQSHPPTQNQYNLSVDAFG